MPSPTEISLKAKSTGALTYYSTYADARSAANAHDVIQIWADLDEQIVLKDGVDIWVAPGRILKMTDSPTITDNGSTCVCNIFGNAIIKNVFENTKHECLRITDSDSQIYVSCDYLEAEGAESDSRNAPTVYVSQATKFTLICNEIINHINSAVIISNCDDFLIKCKRIRSGIEDSEYKNLGAEVVYLNGIGSIFADELICDGFGSCLSQAGGSIFAKISKVKSLEAGDPSYPTIFLGDGNQGQLMILYFDEIQNLNSNGGNAVTIEEGNANLIGRSIYSMAGICLDLAADANIKCFEVKSDFVAIEVHNTSPKKIIVDAGIIEGNSYESAAINVIGGANFMLKNARSKNIQEGGSSNAILLQPNFENMTVQLINVIAVSGNEEGFSIFCDPELGTPEVYNYGLFVNTAIAGFDLLVGTAYNNKYIESIDVS